MGKRVRKRSKLDAFFSLTFSLWFDALESRIIKGSKSFERELIQINSLEPTGYLGL